MRRSDKFLLLTPLYFFLGFVAAEISPDASPLWLNFLFSWVYMVVLISVLLLMPSTPSKKREPYIIGNSNKVLYLTEEELRRMLGHTIKPPTRREKLEVLIPIYTAFLGNLVVFLVNKDLFVDCTVITLVALAVYSLMPKRS